ncbi:MAG: anaerobic sulfatase-maturation protein [Planctomycetota bacterium]
MPVALPVAEGQVSPLRAAPTQSVHTATRPFHVMTKPIGPICNLDCKYCFYLEKEALYQGERKWQMPEDVLEQYIKQYIKSQPGQHVSFAWQGGEPTLLGVRFFRRVVELQKKHGDGRQIDNAFQTNGTLLDDEWGEFLKENNFLIGLSIDGPPELHDSYRVDKQGKASSHNVLRGLEILKKHEVEFNTLTVVNRINSQHPLRVYRYLRDIGSGFIQFIPLVERDATDDAPFKDDGLWLQGPPDVDGGERFYAPVTEWSVRSRDYGVFLATIFDEWIRRDIGETFVQMFDVALGNWMSKMTGRQQASLCVFSETCGSAMAVEHNGDVYSCDHYVYPRYKLGNIMEQALGDMVESPFQKKFGTDKRDTLPKYCRECEVRHACHGECPKHRFIKTPDGEDGLNYLCGAYKPFFNHVDPYMRTMVQLLMHRQPPAMIREMIAEHEKKGGPLGKRFKDPARSKAKSKKRRR